MNSKVIARLPSVLHCASGGSKDTSVSTSDDDSDDTSSEEHKVGKLEGLVANHLFLKCRYVDDWTVCFLKKFQKGFFSSACGSGSPVYLC